MMKTELTLDERFELLRNLVTENAFNEIKHDLYLITFNRPLYVSDATTTDDEARHEILDELHIPRKK